ncbi:MULTISPECIES: TIM barrel protein [unclassified Bradyrhizobium]|uniref:sugar phosphate isomerase/epimerase family protein n=1 Tax=unclassified Bradyrhizobium TaxID=2631580 RepID=UPI0024B17B0A|nr:TIM barrel protein [Bradyrhizobium sp. CB2312]WFU74773.1 TIM barrel protein [Bradyrhizobium sp. CB2312]
MTFGVNLSFCVKRWVTPALWAPVVREDLGLDLIQLSFDLVDPTWPDDLIEPLADDIRRHADAFGINVHSAFIGLAHYTFNQLLHPDPRVRDVAEAWLRRAYRFAGRARIPRVGGPLGAVASRRDGREAENLSPADYDDLIARMHRLADAAKGEGMAELYVEPTPMRREWPWTVDQALKMAEDLRTTTVPWKFCVDWGHGTFEPLYGRYRAGMADWFAALGAEIGVVHVQQTDFQHDRHWDFTEPGRVDPIATAALQRAHGLAATPTFLEVFYPFERDDASVLDAMKRSVALLKPAFA